MTGSPHVCNPTATHTRTRAHTRTGTRTRAHTRTAGHPGLGSSRVRASAERLRAEQQQVLPQPYACPQRPLPHPRFSLHLPNCSQLPPVPRGRYCLAEDPADLSTCHVPPRGPSFISDPALPVTQPGLGRLAVGLPAAEGKTARHSSEMRRGALGCRNRPPAAPDLPQPS